MSWINWLESEFVYWLWGCIDCDSCEIMACPQEFLWRGAKTEKIEATQWMELSVVLSKDRWDLL